MGIGGTCGVRETAGRPGAPCAGGAGIFGTGTDGCAGAGGGAGGVAWRCCSAGGLAGGGETAGAAGAGGDGSGAGACSGSTEGAGTGAAAGASAAAGSAGTAPAPSTRALTRLASSSSIELECVFFPVMPSSGRISRMTPGLTSSSRASSLMRILLMCSARRPAAQDWPSAPCLPSLGSLSGWFFFR